MNQVFNIPKQKHLRRKLRNNATKTEQLLWGVLRKKQLGYKFVRQYGVGRYVLDFYCPLKKIAIELDGNQHNEPEALEYDAIRSNYLSELGIVVLRFWNIDIFNDLELVCDTIIEKIENS